MNEFTFVCFETYSIKMSNNYVVNPSRFKIIFSDLFGLVMCYVMYILFSLDKIINSKLQIRFRTVSFGSLSCFRNISSDSFISVSFRFVDFPVLEIFNSDSFCFVPFRFIPFRFVQISNILLSIHSVSFCSVSIRSGSFHLLLITILILSVSNRFHSVPFHSNCLLYRVILMNMERNGTEWNETERIDSCPSLAWTPGRFCEVASHGKAFSFFSFFLKKISINCRFFTQKEHLPAQKKRSFARKK